MENIRQAIERAKGQGAAPLEQQRTARPSIPPQRSDVSAPPRYEAAPPIQEVHPSIQEVQLSSPYLRTNRVVSHVGTDPLSRPFDMLRTQVLHSMDASGAKVLAITSPSPGCGKTVTAVNLAFSIARQSERSVLLVDLDLVKPRVAMTVGLETEDGVLGVLEGRKQLQDAIIHAKVGKQGIMLLPTRATTGSSELMGSRAMATMLQDIKRNYPSHIILVDLPPVLTSDDVIAILPQMDCVLLVAAVGNSKVAEIEECSRHLKSSDVIRIVVNKVPDAGNPYYYY